MITLQPSNINGYFSPQDPGEPGRNQRRLSVNDDEGRVLQTLLRGLQVLEIGTGLGVSTRWLAGLCSHVYTVDIDPWVKENVVPTLPSNVTFHEELLGAKYCLGGAFIDGRHELEYTKRDIMIARMNLANGAPIVFHDTRIPEVLMAIQESGLPFVLIETNAGMGLAWNEEPNGR